MGHFLALVRYLCLNLVTLVRGWKIVDIPARRLPPPAGWSIATDLFLLPLSLSLSLCLVRLLLYFWKSYFGGGGGSAFLLEEFYIAQGERAPFPLSRAGWQAVQLL